MKFKIPFNLKYFLIWFFIVLWINYSTFLWQLKNNQDQENSQNNILTVEIWNIEKSIEISGTSQLVDEQSLKFNKTWTITKVNFKAWDSVKKWDIIAEIDNTDWYVSIEEAKINLDNAMLSLSDLMKWADESQLLQSKNNIENAEKNIIISEQELENLKISQQLNLLSLSENISNTKKELEISKNNLEISKKDLDLFIKEKIQNLWNSEINKSTTIKNIEESFKNYLIDIEKNIDELDSILWYTDKYKNKVLVYEIYLWAKNSSYKSQAKNFLASSIWLYDNLDIKILNYTNNWNIDEIKIILDEISKVFNELYNANDYTYKTVDNSVISVWAITQNDIDSMKNSTLNYRSNTSNKISSINSVINNLSTLTDLDLISESNKNSIISKQESIKLQELSIEKQEFNLENSKKSLEETKKTYELTLKSKENDIFSKKTNLQILKLNYNDLLEWATKTNIAKANNTIKQAQIRLNSATKNLDDYVLKAPFDWVIRKIDYMIGDNLTSDTAKYVYIENPNLLEIKVMLDQIDIVKVKIWMEAKIVFDAYPTIPVKAIISSIDTKPSSNSGIVSYEVKLILNDNDFDKKILSWFWANIEIITQLSENILLLKTSAIYLEDWLNYVTLLKNGKEEKRQVTIWINNDWKTEILSWLEQWDKVLEKKFISTTTTKTSTSTSIFSVPTWWTRTWNIWGPPAWF